VGVHGTNDPSTIGTDVSHGCIRLRNEDILELSNDVHLGTPVFVED
jgi:lipoprotein-anchoring transpeptidase ErfK/SrfK